MYTILLVIHVLVAIALIGLILIQHGKGADAGAAFGSGASSTVFGARGSGSFLTRLTAILATVFFISSFTLAYLTTLTLEDKSLPSAEVTAPGQGEPGVPAEPAAEDVPAIPEDVPAGAPAGDAQDVPAAPPAEAGDAPADVPAAPAAEAPATNK
jgi:preprotein translocase subunit SecG